MLMMALPEVDILYWQGNAFFRGEINCGCCQMLPFPRLTFAGSIKYIWEMLEGFFFFICCCTIWNGKRITEEKSRSATQIVALTPGKLWHRQKLWTGRKTGTQSNHRQTVINTLWQCRIGWAKELRERYRVRPFPLHGTSTGEIKRTRDGIKLPPQQIPHVPNRTTEMWQWNQTENWANAR